MFFFVMTLLVKSAFNIHEIIVIISVFKVRTSQNFNLRHNYHVKILLQ